MVASVATWTEATLGSPRTSGYQIQQAQHFVRSDVAVGEARYRTIQEVAPAQVDVEIVQTNAQHATFESWFASTLDDGLGWFTVDVYDAGGATTAQAHIVGGYSAQPIGRNLDHVLCAMTWQLVIPDV